MTVESAFDPGASLLQESIERYAAGVDAKLTACVNNEWCCEVALHGMKFSVFVEDPFIGLQTHFSQSRPLSAYATARLEAEMVHVETNCPGEASLAQYLRSDVLIDDKEFHSRINNFVSITKQVAESRRAI